MWPLVVGGVVFGVAYGGSLYEALSGRGTSYGVHDFGSPGLLLVPLVGPVLFGNSFCADASAYYEKHSSEDEPENACGSGMWALVSAAQIVGAGFVAAAFLFPATEPAKPVARSRVRLEPIADRALTRGTLGLRIVGEF